MFYDILIYIKLCVGEGSFRIIWIIVEFVLVVYLRFYLMFSVNIRFFGLRVKF